MKRIIFFGALIITLTYCNKFPKAVFENPPERIYKNWQVALPMPENAAQFDSIFYKSDKGVIKRFELVSTITSSEKGIITLNVYGKKGRTVKRLLIKKYSVVQLPYPNASLMPFNVDKVTPAILRNARALHAFINVSNIETWGEILEFEVYLLDNTKGQHIMLKNKGQEFQPDVKLLLNDARPGDLILFNNIRSFYRGENDTMILKPYVVSVVKDW